jgi:hypothetical protein
VLLLRTLALAMFRVGKLCKPHLGLRPLSLLLALKASGQLKLLGKWRYR